jgi:hypothetical protein
MSEDHQGCQRVYIQTKSSKNLCKFWMVLQWKKLVYFMAIWCILLPFGIFCGHLEYYIVVWYIFPRFGMLHQKNLATLKITLNKPTSGNNRPCDWVLSMGDSRRWLVDWSSMHARKPSTKCLYSTCMYMLSWYKHTTMYSQYHILLKQTVILQACSACFTSTVTEWT